MINIKIFILRGLLTQKLGYLLTIASLILTSLILIGSYHTNVFAQALDKGIVGQIVGDEKTQFYIRNVKVTEDSGDKIVDVSVVFKNKGSSQQVFSLSSLRLVDSESRQYEPRYSFLEFSSGFIPSNDTLALDAKFKILPSNNFSKIYFFPGFFRSESRLIVDLTKSKNPADSPPNSSWVLSSNKGVKVSNGEMELTINDEKYLGNTYIIDVTIKNIGNSSIHYDDFNFMVKDVAGHGYSRNSYSLLNPLSLGDLPPGEMVRGDVAFDVKKSDGNMMIIYAGSGSSGVPFLNTGSLSAQNTTKPPVEL